jgi:hypothetical protein
VLTVSHLRIVSHFDRFPFPPVFARLRVNPLGLLELKALLLMGQMNRFKFLEIFWLILRRLAWFGILGANAK